MALIPEDIRDAAKAIDGKIVKTLCAPSTTLSPNHRGSHRFEIREPSVHGVLQGTWCIEQTAFPVPLKVKMRASSPCPRETTLRPWAYHAGRLGIPAVIIMPRHTPNLKVEHTRAFNAEVILKGEDFDEACVFAKKLAMERNLEMVHPYNDEKVMAGQGTVALEMIEMFPDLESIVVPRRRRRIYRGMRRCRQGHKP